MNTYKRIAAVELTTRIIKMLADQKEPVGGDAVAKSLDEKHGTVMCHLATLEDAGFVRKVGGHFELGDALALFWARRKSQLESMIDNARHKLNQLEA
ncbi:MAG: IclR family transcriptional regulator [Desulfuromusa sp.]|nr:IclR family transcriptional regulator [Desulfuromusa sp.]